MLPEELDDRRRAASRRRGMPISEPRREAIAAAGRLGIVRVAALHRRHVGAVRPRHVDAFALLPPGLTAGRGSRLSAGLSSRE